MLQIAQLKKEYNGIAILSVESLLIPNGIVLLQGKNGSGKTTLLRMMAGLIPFGGDISINNVFSLKKQRQQFLRLVNYAETEPLYPGFLTAQELVKLFCYAKKGNLQKTEVLLKALDIYNVYKQPLSTYSSGMIKKLSLALAFAGNPKWILLDEPLITADKVAVDTICTLINEKHTSEGVSFLITSHQDFSNSQLSFTAGLLADEQTISIVA